VTRSPDSLEVTLLYWTLKSTSKPWTYGRVSTGVEDLRHDHPTDAHPGHEICPARNIVNATAPHAARRAGLHLTLVQRAALIALGLFLEKFLLNFLVDFEAAQHATGIGAGVRIAQHWGFRFAVTYAAGVALFGAVRRDQGIAHASAAAAEAPIRWRWLLTHAALLLLLAPLTYSLYGGHGAPWPFTAVLALWTSVACVAAAALILALAPWVCWRRLASAIGSVWLYAGAAALIAASAMQWSEALWRPTAAVTFHLVRWLLLPLIPGLRSDAATQVIDTGRFAVQIADVCSGLEGLGLMAAFCAAWLVYFRKEYIFPRALVIVPLGLIVVFALNVVRIAALTLIGDSGHPDIAVYGFHSQAGWIAFNCAAGTVAFASRRMRWLTRSADSGAVLASDNPTAVYLVPFLAILAAGMIARAASGGFETLYGLRFFAAAAALWAYRGQLAQLDWRCSWRGAAVGAAIFVVWAGFGRLVSLPTGEPTALSAMRPGLAAAWITLRVAGAVITVPIAEELAFRGYLLRRLIAADFEGVSFATVGMMPLWVTAVAFGVSHGAYWLPGILAGLGYGLLLIRTQRIGEAVAAHATTNALLATYVLAFHQWQLW